MLDDERNFYAHSITGRTTNTINNGKVVPRSTGCSLAFRAALDHDGVTTLPCLKSSDF